MNHVGEITVPILFCSGTAPHEFHLAAKRSHSHVHQASSIVDVRPAQGADGGSNMAFRKARDTLEHEQSAETNVEREIRDFVRRDVVAQPSEHEQPAETEVEGEIREFVRRDVATNSGASRNTRASG